MPTAVNTIVSDVTKLLHDAGNIRWTTPDIISWINAGQRAVVRRIPAAFARTKIIELDEGTLQAIPSDGIAFIKAIVNVSAADKALSAPRFIPHMMLDVEDPNWHAADTNKITKTYTFTPEVPHEFWVSPPQPASAGRLRIQYSASPPLAVNGGDTAIDSIYDNALINYSLYRAFDRDSEDANDVRAQRAFTAFEADLA